MRRKKVKWGKRREGQNMLVEVNCSIKSSDLICTNLMGKKEILKNHSGKKISLIMGKTTVVFIW